MRITLLFLFLLVFHVQAEQSYSQVTKISLDMENSSIEKILQSIEEKSEFYFLYNSKLIDVDRKTDIHANEESIASVLTQLFNPDEVEYEVKGTQIILSPKKMYGQLIAVTDVLQQQKRAITGTVVDAAGLPIIGANIVEAGTTNGTVTDTDGKFSLSVGANATIHVSYIGYLEQEIITKSEKTFNIVLQEDVRKLEEFVVVGYGTVKKSELTGSISTIKAEDLQPVVSQRVDQMLQGQSAGVDVRNIESAPGAEPVIRIRGMNSIMGGNKALIVIDGIHHGRLSTLNYQDVQSIEILKGPSATAIYGSEGANGVIIVTTKSGGISKPRITVNTGITVGKIAKKYDLMDAVTYANYRNALRLADNLDFDREPIFSKEDIDKFKKSGGTDWQDEVMGRTAVTQNYDLSISGGTESLKYYVSGSYLDQNGIVLNSGYKRYTTRFKLDSHITSWLDVGVNYSYAQEKSGSPFYGTQIDWPSNAISNSLKFPPFLPVYNEDGSYAFPDSEIAGRTMWNPVASALEPLNDHTDKRTAIHGFLKFNILKGLTFQIDAGVQLHDYNHLRFLNNNTYVGSGDNGTGNISNSSSNYLQNSNILTYHKKIANHEIVFTGVGEIKKQNYFRSFISNNNFPVHSTGIYDAGSASVQTTGSFTNERFMGSYLGRINYNYKNRYFLTASYRADGSSVFGENHKWGYFPSGSLGWRISEEDFIANLGIIHNFMLRASIGLTGNQAITPYQTMAKIGTQGMYPWEGGASSTVCWGVTSVSNPDLKWEETEQQDIGIDISFLGGSLEFTGDYYKKTTRDLLMSKGLPRTTGLSSIIANVGSIENQGYEFSANYTLIKGDFQMTNGFNIGANKSKVLDLGDIDRLGYAAGGSGHGVNAAIMYLFVGEPWGQIYGWGYEGTWSTEEAAQALRYGQLPGDSRYTDLNNDGQIDIQDRHFIGNTIPKFNFGFNSRMSYKNFDFSFLLQGAVGHDILDIASLGANLRENWDDRWTESNQDTNVPAIIPARERRERTKEHPSTISFPAAMSNANSRWVQDGSYIRLKNARISYNFPASIASKLDLKQLSIYVSGENLITLTRYKGYNPEVSSNSDDKALGANFFSYPVARNLGFGLSLTF